MFLEAEPAESDRPRRHDPGDRPRARGPLGARRRRLGGASSRRAETTRPPSSRASTPSSATCTPPASRSSSRPATCRPGRRDSRTGGRIRRPASPRDRRPSTRSATAPSGTTATSPSSSRAATGARSQALECWNEPNLWMYLYPAAHRRRPVLRRPRLPAHAQGVPRRRDARPHGRARRRRRHRPRRPERHATAPARSASPASCSARGAGRYFDVYSHHPYTPGGSINTAPDQPPNDPSHTVTLYNLRTLLRLFPEQALLPHRVRLQHAAEPGVRPRRQRAGPGPLPEDRLPLRGALPAGEAARVVPGPRREAGLGAGRPRRVHAACGGRTGRASRPGTRSGGSDVRRSETAAAIDGHDSADARR